MPNQWKDSRTHFTDHFSIVIHIQCIFHFALLQILLIITILCTWQVRRCVMTREKLCSDIMSRNWFTVKRDFHRSSIDGKNVSEMHPRASCWDGSRGRFKNTYKLINLRALKFSTSYKNHILQCMGKIFCVEFQRFPLKFHIKYLTHTLEDLYFIQWKFKSYYI